MLNETNPIIALTPGEPSGIGLEITYKAWRELGDSLSFFLIADKNHLDSRIGLEHCVEISNFHECTEAAAEGLPFFHFAFDEETIPGKVNPKNAKGILASIRFAVDLSLNNQVAAICTNPITKNVFGSTQSNFLGHTEFLAHLCNVPFTAMMLAGKSLRVVPVSGHQPLANVPREVTKERLEKIIQLSHQSLSRDFGISNPKIYITGLNPHAGEEGLLGDEEKKVIFPVIEKFKDTGFNIHGPYSADTMFHESARSKYDLAICMYHDQALIPIKTLHFYDAVNFTLGLPIVRTSPDHGTALDISGKFIARPDSLVQALLMARDIAVNRMKDG